MAAFATKRLSIVFVAAVAALAAVASAAEAPAPSPTSAAAGLAAPISGLIIASVAALFM